MSESHKETAGRAAVDYVRRGMRVGLGTGSTVRYSILEIGERLADDRLADIVGVSTSAATSELAHSAGIPLMELDGSALDVVIDGADEIDPALALTKGGGGALMREKIVASAADLFIAVAHEDKLVSALGESFAIPVEVSQFGIDGTLHHLGGFGKPEVRLDGGEPMVTENGNFIVDIDVAPIYHPFRFNELLSTIPGVLETGIFVNMADMALIGTESGVELLEGV